MGFMLQLDGGDFQDRSLAQGKQDLRDAGEQWVRDLQEHLPPRRYWKNMDGGTDVRSVRWIGERIQILLPLAACGTDTLPATLSNVIQHVWVDAPLPPPAGCMELADRITIDNGRAADGYG